MNAPCPDCGAKIDYRSTERSPFENEWEPFCPTCGWPDAQDTAPTLDLEAIYDVLVEECGAHDDAGHVERAMFAHHFPECIEYRFQGDLGRGGKVWANNGDLYVTCYPEDETSERLTMIEQANARLAPLAVFP